MTTTPTPEILAAAERFKNLVYEESHEGMDEYYRDRIALADYAVSLLIDDPALSLPADCDWLQSQGLRWTSLTSHGLAYHISGGEIKISFTDSAGEYAFLLTNPTRSDVLGLVGILGKGK